MNSLILNKLNIDLEQSFSCLPMKGTLMLGSPGYYYLKIDNQFIHKPYDMLNRVDINKPNYCDENEMGAHISVIYPEENTKIEPFEMDKIHEFKLVECYSAQLGNKEYFIMTVDSPSLMLLRKKYRLPELLNFKGYNVALHITFGFRVI